MTRIILRAEMPCATPNTKFAAFLVFLYMVWIASAHANTAEPLRWDPIEQTNLVTGGEPSTSFAFKVTNVSKEPITIDDLRPSCGCTVVQLPSKPWILKPKQTDHFDALVDVRGKTGKLFKTIEIVSSNAPGKLNLVIDIQPGTNLMSKEAAMRLFGQQLAATDHQAVFKKDCVSCHLVPAFGKTGEKLYVSACGICHEAKHRADMVPDLHTLKFEITPDYWRNWVTYGKEHTLMPGFASTLGGPLTDAQIDSLVSFLQTVFPRPTTATAVNFNHPDHARN